MLWVGRRGLPPPSYPHRHAFVGFGYTHRLSPAGRCLLEGETGPTGRTRAHHSTADSHRTQTGGQEVEVAGAPGLATEPGGVRARLHHHTEEAQLGAAQGRARPA